MQNSTLNEYLYEMKSDPDVGTMHMNMVSYMTAEHVNELTFVSSLSGKRMGYGLTCAVRCSTSTVTLETVFPVPITAPGWAAKFPS